MQHIAKSPLTVAAEMRDVIWSIDSSKDNMHIMVERMKAYTLETVVPFDITHRFETITIDPNRKLPVEARQNIYILFKETLNNIIKYANATKVDIRLEEKKIRS